MDYQAEKYGDIAVYWNAEVDGGGRPLVRQYHDIVRSLLGRVERVFEFCAGTGFIGFSLMASGLCETLCLAEINPKAINALQKTVAENQLDDRVSVYLSDGLEGIPDTEKWDLVVGFPPHHPAPFEIEDDSDLDSDGPAINLVCIDLDLDLHRRFYRDVHKFLKPHGSVILVENYEGADESVLDPFLKSGGLELVRSFMYCDEDFPLNSYYFLWSRPKVHGVIYREAEATTINLVLSRMQGQVTTKKLHEFEKVRLEIVNDLNRKAEIALRQEQGWQRVIKLMPGERKISAVYLFPPGRLSIFEVEKEKMTEHLDQRVLGRGQPYNGRTDD